MPQYDIQSPGANAGMAMQKYLLDQAARDRQAQLDAQALAHQQETERLDREQEKRAAELQTAQLREHDQQRQIALIKEMGRGASLSPEQGNTEVGRAMSDAAAPAVVDTVTPEMNPTKQQGIYPGIVSSSAQSIGSSAEASGRVSRGTVQEQAQAAGLAREQKAGELLNGVTDRAEAMQTLLKAGYPAAEADTTVTAMYGPIKAGGGGKTILYRTPKGLSFDVQGHKPFDQPFDSDKFQVEPLANPPANPEDALVRIETVNAKGENVVEYLPKSEVRGQTYSKAIGQTVMSRLTSAQAVDQTANDIVTELSDPAYAKQVGVVMGRYNTLQDFIGDPPPEYSQLAGQIESFALANMGVHGMRSAQGAEQIKKLLTQKHTPESLISTIKGLNSFSRHYMENQGMPVAGPATKTDGGAKPASAAPPNETPAARAKRLYDQLTVK